jgi:D-cysteine desulfhydrase/L-cysteate sulfo-lyase
MAERLGARPATVGADGPLEVDDSQVGEGYGVPTSASTEALELVARREGVLLDPVYTAKAMAGLMGRVRAGEFTPEQTVLFWHTGGGVGFFH